VLCCLLLVMVNGEQVRGLGWSMPLLDLGTSTHGTALTRQDALHRLGFSGGSPMDRWSRSQKGDLAAMLFNVGAWAQRSKRLMGHIRRAGPREEQ
jgi:hypothetical protein